MERAYRFLPWFFVGLTGILIWGFYRTYFQFFPQFTGFKFFQHFHGAMMLIWLLMLFVQPLLIIKKKLALHRLIGKLSYVVVPLLLFSIFLASKSSNQAMAKSAPEPVAVSMLALNVPGIAAFGIFYLLAIIHRNYSAWHMRYMIGTSLLMIGPGLGRALIIYFGFPFPLGVSVSDYVAIAIASALLVLDYKNKKSLKPYSVILGVLLFVHLLWEARDTAAWQAFGKWYAGVFY